MNLYMHVCLLHQTTIGFDIYFYSNSNVYIIYAKYICKKCSSNVHKETLTTSIFKRKNGEIRDFENNIV